MTQQRRSRRSQRKDSQITTHLSTDSAIPIHADGVWGGLTPKGQLMMGFFTEQFAVPESVTYELPEALPGSLREVSRRGGGYILREIRAEIFMSLPVAESFHRWLGDKLDEAAAALQESGTEIENNVTSSADTIEREAEE